MSTEKQPISSLEGVEILPGRRVGNTTRIIDNAIQLLFKGETVKVVDHYSGGRGDHIDRIAFKIMDRLRSEHHYNKVTYNHVHHTLKLK